MPRVKTTTEPPNTAPEAKRKNTGQDTLGCPGQRTDRGRGWLWRSRGSVATSGFVLAPNSCTLSAKDDSRPALDGRHRRTAPAPHRHPSQWLTQSASGSMERPNGASATGAPTTRRHQQGRQQPAGLGSAAEVVARLEAFSVGGVRVQRVRDGLQAAARLKVVVQPERMTQLVAGHARCSAAPMA